MPTNSIAVRGSIGFIGLRPQKVFSLNKLIAKTTRVLKVTESIGDRNRDNIGIAARAKPNPVNVRMIEAKRTVAHIADKDAKLNSTRITPDKIVLVGHYYMNKNYLI